MRFLRPLLLVSLLTYSSLTGFAQGATALKGVRIVPGIGPIVEKGNVVMQGDKIVAVGADAAIPEGATIIDGAGLTVYPGLIDMFCLGGVAAPPTAGPAVSADNPFGRPGGGGQRPPQGANRPTQPALPAAAPLVYRKPLEGFDPKAGALAAMRNSGYTAAIFGVRGVLTPGENALMTLQPGDAKAMLLAERVSVNVNTQSRGFNSYPSTLMGAYAYVRQALYDAVDYVNRKPEKSDFKLESLGAASTGKAPVFYAANSENDILRGIKLAKEFNLKLLVLGGKESAAVASKIQASKGTVVLTDDWSPAEALLKAGVPFAFGSNKAGMDAGDAEGLRTKMIELAEKGISTDALLAALTRVPAEAIGHGDKLGAVAVGKIANLTITDGDLFKKATKVKFVVVRGAKIEPAKEMAALDPRYRRIPEDGVAYRYVGYDDADVEDGKNVVDGGGKR